MGEALQDIGFFALTGHGDVESIKKSYAVAEEFFQLHKMKEPIRASRAIPSTWLYSIWGRACKDNLPDLKNSGNRPNY